VADKYRRFTLYHGVEILVDFILCPGVKGGGGFVQDNDGAVLEQDPGYGDLLRLAAGRFKSAVVERFI
jgi:hypothetical protein